MDYNIKDLYECVKDNCLSVFKTGSCVLQYLDFYGDIDYIFLYDTEEHALAAQKTFKNYYNLRTLHVENHIDIHFRSLEKSLDGWGFNNDIEVIIGDPNIKNKLPFLLDDINIVKEYIKKRIIKIKQLLLKNPKIAFYERKDWYYIYRMISILKNNSYELTNEQKRIINILHNKKKEEKEIRKQIIDDLIQEVESWLF